MFETDEFIYIHMQKTGGVRIREILAELTGGREVGRRHGYLDHKPDHRLVFGSVRNPWAWYVSLWAFGCEGKGGVLSWLVGDPAWQRVYADADDPALFREWLGMVYDVAHSAQMRNGYERFDLRPEVGLMSWRYTYLYAASVDMENVGHFGDYFSLAQYHDYYNMVDYWIKLEDLAYTLWGALKLGGCEVKRERVRQLCEIQANVSQHRPFRQYYDAETIELVRERERLIVERHGYGF